MVEPRSGDAAAGQLGILSLDSLDPVMLARLTRYGREALGESALDEWLLPVIAGCGRLYVAEAGARIVGSAEVLRCMDDGDLYLEGLYVRPEFQGRGYGAALLAHVMSELARDGYDRLLATLAPDNTVASRLYERAGFRELRLLSDHYGPGRDRRLLAAALRTKASQADTASGEGGSR